MDTLVSDVQIVAPNAYIRQWCRSHPGQISPSEAASYVGYADWRSLFCADRLQRYYTGLVPLVGTDLARRRMTAIRRLLKSAVLTIPELAGTVVPPLPPLPRATNPWHWLQYVEPPVRRLIHDHWNPYPEWALHGLSVAHKGRITPDRLLGADFANEILPLLPQSAEAARIWAAWGAILHALDGTDNRRAAWLDHPRAPQGFRRQSLVTQILDFLIGADVLLPSFRTASGPFLRWCEQQYPNVLPHPMDHIAAPDLTVDHLRAWRQHLQRAVDRHAISSNTMRSYVAGTRAVLRAYRRLGMPLEAALLRVLVGVRATRPHKNLAWAAGDVETFLTIVDKTGCAEHQALFHFLASTGCRPIEICRLTPGDLNSQTQCVRLTGKRGRQRILPVKPATFERLARVANNRHDAESLFQVSGRKCTTRHIRVVFRRYWEAAGICGPPDLRAFRHTIVTLLGDQEGVRLADIMVWAGHRCPATTGGYWDTDERQLRRTLRTVWGEEQTDG